VAEEKIASSCVHARLRVGSLAVLKVQGPPSTSRVTHRLLNHLHVTIVTIIRLKMLACVPMKAMRPAHMMHHCQSTSVYVISKCHLSVSALAVTLAATLAATEAPDPGTIWRLRLVPSALIYYKLFGIVCSYSLKGVGGWGVIEIASGNLSDARVVP
jgi:hypothetical protein